LDEIDPEVLLRRRDRGAWEVTSTRCQGSRMIAVLARSFPVLTPRRTGRSGGWFH
jgi:hypothetical protein